MRPRAGPLSETTGSGCAADAASRTLNGAPDEALAQAAAGCAAAFDELFCRYAPRVRQFVAWQTGGGEDAVDELTQEVFFQLYRSLPRFAGRSSFRTWLYALAGNVCRHHRRRRQRRLRWLRPSAEDEPALDEVPDLAAGVVERLERSELRGEVRRQVARLPPHYRSVLLLRDWEDLSYAEIADVLAIPVGTVRSRLHQARVRLAAALQGETAGGTP